jgi:hypothetical protein
MCACAAGKLSKAQAAVEKLHSQLEGAGQPHGFLLSQLAAAEAAASQAQEQLEAAQVGAPAWSVVILAAQRLCIPLCTTFAATALRS